MKASIGHMVLCFGTMAYVWFLQIVNKSLTGLLDKIFEEQQFKRQQEGERFKKMHYSWKEQFSLHTFPNVRLLFQFLFLTLLLCQNLQTLLFVVDCSPQPVPPSPPLSSMPGKVFMFQRFVSCRKNMVTTILDGCYIQWILLASISLKKDGHYL